VNNLGNLLDRTIIYLLILFAWVFIAIIIPLAAYFVLLYIETTSSIIMSILLVVFLTLFISILIVWFKIAKLYVSRKILRKHGD